MITIFEIEWTFWAGIYKQNFELKNYVLEFSRWNPMGKYFWCNAAAVIIETKSYSFIQQGGNGVCVTQKLYVRHENAEQQPNNK